MNAVTIAGNLTQDARRGDVNGIEVCNFSIADNAKRKGVDVVTFWDCALWGAQSQLGQYLMKGRHVTIVGEVTSIEVKDGRAYPRVRVSLIDLGPKPGTASAADAPDLDRIPF